MNWLEKLREGAHVHGSILCMGMDPVLEKMPEKLRKVGAEKAIVKFYLGILEGIKGEDVWPSIVKPNIAYYERYGFEGLRALKKLIIAYQKAGLSVILDAKRGDIGRSSRAYAHNIFEFWGADATTLPPYMGSDSIAPFISYSKAGKGNYILNRTSNPGAKEIQNLKVEVEDKKTMPLYLFVSQKIVEIGGDNKGVGAVVGATSLEELKKIASFYLNSDLEIPLLIPGVGAQGGSAKEVTEVLKKVGYPLELVRINSSSGINYAYLKYKEKPEAWVDAALDAIKALNREIRYG